MPPSIESDRRKLEDKLRVRLLAGCDECDSFGYHPTDFRKMIAAYGAVETCLRVLRGQHPPDGLLKMVENGRLDLTAEAIMLNGSWRVLFPDAILDKCRKRLRDYGRPDLAIDLF